MSTSNDTVTTNPKPDWLDNGDNAWQLTSATLVAMQSLVGLSAIYAGMVKKKWAINSMFMVFYAFAMGACLLVVESTIVTKLTFYLNSPGLLESMGI